MRIATALSMLIDYVYCDKPIDSTCLYRVSFIAFIETSRNAIDPCLACGSGLFDRHGRHHHGLSVESLLSICGIRCCSSITSS